ncbi:MAG: hypothetical protein WA414_17725 [Acidobacteriaceae bacterium]
MSAPVAEPMIEAELWVSFVSLLRAYFAVGALDGATVVHIETSESSIILTADVARLEMRCDPQTGEGNWLLKNSAAMSQGRFTLMPDGRLDLDGKTLELDHAAIDLVAALMRVSTSARNEI